MIRSYVKDVSLFILKYSTLDYLFNGLSSKLEELKNYCIRTITIFELLSTSSISVSDAQVSFDFPTAANDSSLHRLMFSQM
jgi:hypothetical protein